jgi:hypothetical protein
MYYKRCKLEESHTEDRRQFSRLIDVDVDVDVDININISIDVV